FRFYADPFDVDFSTLIECSLCQPGLFEITPLNYTMHSSSDATNALPPNVTLTTSSHHLYNPTTSNSMSPPFPPSISTFNSTKIHFHFHFQY
ncbi:unnamed protein product, partial [Rotaria sp. Silwood1]